MIEKNNNKMKSERVIFAVLFAFVVSASSSLVASSNALELVYHLRKAEQCTMFFAGIRRNPLKTSVAPFVCISQ